MACLGTTDTKWDGIKEFHAELLATLTSTELADRVKSCPQRRVASSRRVAALSLSLSLSLAPVSLSPSQVAVPECVLACGQHAVNALEGRARGKPSTGMQDGKACRDTQELPDQKLGRTPDVSSKMPHTCCPSCAAEREK